MRRSGGAAGTPSNGRVWACAALLVLGAEAGCAGGAGGPAKSSAKSVVIDGTEVSFVRTERVKAIAEERANVKAGEGQEFVKVVLALKGTRPSEELPVGTKMDQLSVEGKPLSLGGA